jgi:serine phosphatase RsbU (regulator of sigma subunit)
MSNLKLQVLWRLLLISGLISLFFYLVQNHRIILVLIFVGLVIVIQVIDLFQYLDRTNRELSRLLQAIGNSDFTQSFSFEKLGSSFSELNRAFSLVQKKFLKLRSEREEQFRYLNTVVKHAGVGLISFKSNGNIEFINNTAKHILQVSALSNIRSLAKQRPALVNAMMKLKAGENTSVKIKAEDHAVTLSVHVTQFVLHGEYYTLASIQNIQSEIDREKMSREFDIAREIQQSLLPGDHFQIPGVDISGGSIPAKEVGGDYYDFIRLGEASLALILGDVSGKGISAAFYMTLIKGLIMVLLGKNLTPKQILVELNGLLFTTLEKKSFVTMFIAMVDMKNGKLSCARAGHNPALFYSAGKNSISRIKPAGMALGFRANPVFSENIEEQEICYSRNDWLIIYSDGIVEARNPELSEFGDQRFMETVQRFTDRDSQTLLNGLFDEVNRFSHPSTKVTNDQVEQHDDMTVLAVKFT